MADNKQKRPLIGRRQVEGWDNLVKTSPVAEGQVAAPQVIRDATLQYAAGIVIVEDNDLVTKEFVDALVAELAPPDADRLTGLALSISGGTAQTFSGFLADSSGAAYKVGTPAGSQVSCLMNDGDFVLAVASQATAFNAGDAGELGFTVNDSEAASFDLAAAFDEAYRDSAQIYTRSGGGQFAGYASTAGEIQIVAVGKYNGFKKWQKCNAELKSVGLLRRGYNTMRLAHDLPADQLSAMFELFLDGAVAVPSVAGLALTPQAPTSVRYLSGVRFFGLSDVMTCDLTGSGLASDAYLRDNPVTLSGLCGAQSVDLPFAGIPVPGQQLAVSGRTLALTVADRCTVNARVTATPRNPYSTGSAALSASGHVVVSTFSVASSNTVEYFCDENRRLTLGHAFDVSSPVTGQWDGTAPLGSGDAQCYVVSENVHGLVYPSVDFSVGYLPAQIVNYAGSTGDRKYARCFVASSSKTSVTLQLNGVTGGLAQLDSGDLNVEIKLPTQTGWLDALKAYSSSDGVGSDGFGCLSGSVSYSAGNAVLNLTFGGRATVDSGGRMYVRLTLRNQSRIVSRLTCTNW